MEQGLALLYTSPLLFSALFGAGLTLYILRKRHTPSSIALLSLTLAAAWWSFGYAMEFLSAAPEAMLFWAKFQYIGITSAPLAWVIFALRYYGAPAWTQHLRYRVLLGLVPSLTLGLVWTNELHGLIWREWFIQPVGPLSVLGVRYGPWFYVHLAYSYALLIWGSIRLLGGLFTSARLYRWQVSLALIAIAVPWLGNSLYVSGLNPIPHVDWTPFAFTATGLLLTISLLRFHLIDILPIAQKTVFRELPDCLLVLDRQDCLVDMNEAAEQVTGKLARELYGQPLGETLPALKPWLALARFDEEYQAELTWGEGSEHHHYQLRIAPLSGPYPLAVGRLVVCHEITHLKQEQSRLEQAVSERTAELKKAVVQLQNELAERALAERRFEQMVESAPDAMVLTDEDGQVQLVNAQVERLLGYGRQELVGQNYEAIIPPKYHPLLGQVVEQIAADPADRQRSYRLEIHARRKDGHLLPLEISLGSLETAGGFWLTCNLRDISQRVQHEQDQARLLERVRQSREQLSALATRLAEVQEAEQRRIALELHDRVGQNLTGLNLNLQAIQSLVPPDEGAALRRLEDSLALVEETTRQVRGLMADLHPPLLEEYGLLAALRFAGEKFAERTGIQIHISEQEGQLRLAPRVERALFRIVQECLNNVVKHAQATLVEISYTMDEQTALLSVQDNGRGFDMHELPDAKIQPTWGLVTIQERAAAIGGRLQVHSAPGQGACVQIEIERGASHD
jgi:PAS domain S-box-containing protein